MPGVRFEVGVGGGGPAVDVQGVSPQTSMTAGTIFDKTRTPLVTCFAAAWYVTSHKHGASALELQRVVGLGSYKTAWTVLHRLRSAMVRPSRDRLGGDGEVDESYVGGEEPGVHGRQTQTKSIVAIAAEMHRLRVFGRTRLRHVDGVSAASLMPFVRHVVEPGSTVVTDGWEAYDGLPEVGYTRCRRVRSAWPHPAPLSMPEVHRVASLLKRWLPGTRQGSVGPQHLQSHLDEFTFTKPSTRFAKPRRASGASWPAASAPGRRVGHRDPPRPAYRFLRYRECRVTAPARERTA